VALRAYRRPGRPDPVDLHTTVAPPAPTASWLPIEDGKIMRIRVTFDRRALTGGRRMRWPGAASPDGSEDRRS